VVLDIVSRVLGPDEYMVIFTDTGMEIPFTHENVAKTEKAYKTVYPGLKFYTAKPPKDTLQFWKEFGPPSRLQRWCCSVCKTAPFANLIQKIYEDKGGEGKAAVLVFEGVRAEESDKRKDYLREAKGVKHISIINSRPILYWNTSEIYLYLFYRNIDLNTGYRHGLTRVGCSICPFSSEWSEYIINYIFPELTGSYINIIKSALKHLGLTDENKVRNYVLKEQWKKRAGGKGIKTDDVSLDIIYEGLDLVAILKNPREDFFEWLKTIGDTIYKKDENIFIGELRVATEVFNYKVNDIEKNKRIINIEHIGTNINLQGKLKKICYKTAYCVHCGVCAVECPTKALKVVPIVKIDQSLCIHCSNCLNFAYKGCLVAKSINESTGDGNMKKKTSGIDRYSTFGMRKEWLDAFLNNYTEWLNNNNLGPKQKPAMRWWLIASGLLDSITNTATGLCPIFNKLKANYMLIWELLWINLSYGSLIVKWYVNNVEFGIYTKEDLIERLVNDFSGYSKPTLENPRDALVNMFDNSPLGKELKLAMLTKKGNAVISIQKIGTDEIHPMAIAYSLYKFAEDKRRYDLTVAEFYKQDCEGGPYKLFGISKFAFENNLRTLQEEKNQIVRVDLAADLDNIFLREDITSLDILEMDI